MIAEELTREEIRNYIDRETGWKAEIYWPVPVFVQGAFTVYPPHREPIRIYLTEITKETADKAIASLKKRVAG